MAETPAETIRRAAKLAHDRALLAGASTGTFLLAIADWLESCARDADDAVIKGDQVSYAYCDDPPGIESALTIAVAYLGTA